MRHAQRSSSEISVNLPDFAALLAANVVGLGRGGPYAGYLLTDAAKEQSNGGAHVQTSAFENGGGLALELRLNSGNRYLGRNLLIRGGRGGFADSLEQSQNRLRGFLETHRKTHG